MRAEYQKLPIMMLIRGFLAMLRNGKVENWNIPTFRLLDLYTKEMGIVEDKETL